MSTCVVLAFFLCAFFVGLLVHDDYGISSDEPQMYSFGVQVYAYLFMDGPVPSMYDWTSHNPLFHIFMVAAQRWLALDNGQGVWLLRHFLTYLLFLLGMWAFYSIALRALGDWTMALLGCVFLFVSPRIFAHAFHNPKDIPALVSFTISMATLLRLRASGYTSTWTLLHALACAVSTSIRSTGLLVPLFTVVVFSRDTLSNRSHSLAATRHVLIRGLLFALMFPLFLVMVWPLLWSDPLGHFVAAFLNAASRDGGGLYFGSMLGPVLPWHYVPVWIAITTPILYSALFLLGCSMLFVRFFRTSVVWCLVASWFFVPLAAIAILPIGIFDEWRHVLFVYPAFLLLALYGAQWLLTHPRAFVRHVSYGIVCTSVLWTSGWMIGNHPRQYAYFSIPSHWVEGNFELDYWGLSYREGLAWVLAHDSRPLVPVYTAARAGYVSGDLLPEDMWARLRFVSARTASYILDNFRWNGYRHALPDERALYHITADGLRLLTVYHGPDREELYPKHTE